MLELTIPITDRWDYASECPTPREAAKVISHLFVSRFDHIPQRLTAACGVSGHFPCRLSCDVHLQILLHAFMACVRIVCHCTPLLLRILQGCAIFCHRGLPVFLVFCSHFTSGRASRANTVRGVATVEFTSGARGLLCLTKHLAPDIVPIAPPAKLGPRPLLKVSLGHGCLQVLFCGPLNLGRESVLVLFLVKSLITLHDFGPLHAAKVARDGHHNVLLPLFPFTQRPLQLPDDLHDQSPKKAHDRLQVFWQVLPARADHLTFEALFLLLQRLYCLPARNAEPANVAQLLGVISLEVNPSQARSNFFVPWFPTCRTLCGSCRWVAVAVAASAAALQTALADLLLHNRR
mmetsp:Transcript_10619/g.29965  ORF Transcript_10619/g.29965 Transcript_10619/m.29965 type:complete len:348 (-) Transcript_10619:653-1696(-)